MGIFLWSSTFNSSNCLRPSPSPSCFLCLIYPLQLLVLLFTLSGTQWPYVKLSVKMTGVVCLRGIHWQTPVIGPAWVCCALPAGTLNDALGQEKNQAFCSWSPSRSKKWLLPGTELTCHLISGLGSLILLCEGYFLEKESNTCIQSRCCVKIDRPTTWGGLHGTSSFWWFFRTACVETHKISINYFFKTPNAFLKLPLS